LLYIYYCYNINHNKDDIGQPRLYVGENIDDTEDFAKISKELGFNYNEIYSKSRFELLITLNLIEKWDINDSYISSKGIQFIENYINGTKNIIFPLFNEDQGILIIEKLNLIIGNKNNIFNMNNVNVGNKNTIKGDTKVSIFSKIKMSKVFSKLKKLFSKQ